MTGLHVLNGPRIPETVWHPFLCAHFHGTLMGRDCLRRQMARRKPNPIAKDQSDRVPPHLEYCASGACQQGAEVKAKFPDWKPEERTGPAPNWMSDILPRRPPPVEQLKREVADLVLSSKKPSWQEFKAQRDRERAEAPAPEPVETEPHPLSNRGTSCSPTAPDGRDRGGRLDEHPAPPRRHAVRRRGASRKPTPRRRLLHAREAPLVIACDSYTKVRWNMRACGATVEALRTIQRHGATELLERAFTGLRCAAAEGRRGAAVVGGARRAARAPTRSEGGVPRAGREAPSRPRRRRGDDERGSTGRAAANTETVDVKGAAELLHTTPRVIYVRHQKGQMPRPIPGSRRLIWRRADLLRGK
jgi:hypothetical protein